MDGGLTWEDADSITGPELLTGTDPQFRVIASNTGNVDVTVDVSDSDFASLSVSGFNLAAGATDVVIAGPVNEPWTEGQHTNTATVDASYSDDGGNTYTEQQQDDANYLGANPSYTVSKVCTNEPVPQGGPATYQVSFTNTGNVPISITADDGIGEFSLAVGETKTFDVSLPGPFGSSETADNTVTATGSYTDSAGNQWTPDLQSASASCEIGGRININKQTTFEGVDASDKYTWNFAIYDADGNELATDTTSPGDTLLDFGLYNLDPGTTYTVCELGLPAGWSSIWRIDTDGDGVADSIVLPFNPNQSDNPAEDLGVRCYDLTVSAGGTLVLDILNQHPGGGPRTPGYWKNWNRVTDGGQDENADRNGGWEEGFWLLEDVLNPNVGGGINWDDILDDSFVFNITNAAVAVDILDQREIGDENVVGDGVKHSNDAAYTLAMHLLAAQLNFGAGAETCEAAQNTALAAEQLLDKYDFDGTGDYLLSKYKKPELKDDYNLAIELATWLDLYNNGEQCDGETVPPPVPTPDDPPTVDITSPADSAIVSGESVDITAQASDDNVVTQIEFFVEGISIGVDSDSSDGWSANWDLTGVADGDYIIIATATDDASQSGSHSIVVTVDNADDAPTVGITSPADGATVSGDSVDIIADASDDNLVMQIEFVVTDSGNNVVFNSVDDVDDGWSATWDSTGVADGDYTITASATDDASQTGSHSIVVTVDNVADPPDPPMHIGDLDASTASGKGGKWDATVTITVHDAADDPVANATISGTWSDGTAGSCVTDGSGQCIITLSSINKNTDSVTFTVDSVSASGYAYDAGANHDPDGDSDGTSIVVGKP